MALAPASKKAKTRRGLEERLAAGETILCAEGYLLAFARSAYVARGLWVPDFILDFPDVLKQKHYEFVRAGSDVTEAYQYYTHRKRMEMVGKEDETERINRLALRIAREVAEDTGTLLAGGISNTEMFLTEKEDPSDKIRSMFEEQVRWSKEEGVDFIIAETIDFLKEAKIAVEVIRSFDLPAVVALSIKDPLAKKDGKYATNDGVPIGEACRSLLNMGATLVGVNCSQGPLTMIKVVEQICEKVPPEKVCALPVTFRTSDEAPTWYLLQDKTYPKNNPVYPNGLDAFYVSEAEIVHFTQRCLQLGLKYIGLCCGNSGNYTRVMAEAMGKNPPCNKYRSKVALKRGMDLTSRRIETIAKNPSK